MKTKDRRNSGRKVTKIYDPVEEPFEEVYWDDWDDYRDRLRDPETDRTLKTKSRMYWGKEKREEINKRIKKKEMIRKKKRESRG